MILMVKFKYKKDQRKNYINNKTFKFKMIDLKKIIENSYSILFSFYFLVWRDGCGWGWGLLGLPYTWINIYIYIYIFSLFRPTILKNSNETLKNINEWLKKIITMISWFFTFLTHIYLIFANANVVNNRIPYCFCGSLKLFHSQALTYNF